MIQNLPRELIFDILLYSDAIALASVSTNTFVTFNQHAENYYTSYNKKFQTSFLCYTIPISRNSGSKYNISFSDINTDPKYIYHRIKNIQKN